MRRSAGSVRRSARNVEGSIDCEERKERKVAAQYMRRGVRNVEG